MYKCTGCNDGWDLSSGSCNAHVCDANAFPYTSQPDSAAGTIVTCKSGTATKYGYSSCNVLWEKNYGYCKMIGVEFADHLAVAMTDEGSMTYDQGVARCAAKTTGGKIWHLPPSPEWQDTWHIASTVNSKLRNNGGTALSGTYWTLACSNPDDDWQKCGDSHCRMTYFIDPVHGSCAGQSKSSWQKYKVRCVFEF